MTRKEEDMEVNVTINISVGCFQMKGNLKSLVWLESSIEN